MLKLGKELRGYLKESDDLHKLLKASWIVCRS